MGCRLIHQGKYQARELGTTCASFFLSFFMFRERVTSINYAQPTSPYSGPSRFRVLLQGWPRGHKGAPCSHIQGLASYPGSVLQQVAHLQHHTCRFRCQNCSAIRKPKETSFFFFVIMQHRFYTIASPSLPWRGITSSLKRKTLFSRQIAVLIIIYFCLKKCKDRRASGKGLISSLTEHQPLHARQQRQAIRKQFITHSWKNLV